MPILSLILPVLDEEKIIQKVVEDIARILDKTIGVYEIILVENGSTDKSWEKVKELEKQNPKIRAIQTSKGYGRAIIKGLTLAKGKFVSYMPSDGQIDIEVLPAMWADLKTGKFDIVKIRRTSRESAVRFARSIFFNFLARLLFAIDITDINGSPRIFERQKLRILELSYKDSFIDTEFAVKAHILKWKIKELPMKNLDRVGGRSTVQLNTVFEFIVNLCVFRFGSRLNHWKLEHDLL